MAQIGYIFSSLNRRARDEFNGTSCTSKTDMPAPARYALAASTI
jgi:hypothetical protein